MINIFTFVCSIFDSLPLNLLWVFLIVLYLWLSGNDDYADEEEEIDEADETEEEDNKAAMVDLNHQKEIDELKRQLKEKELQVNVALGKVKVIERRLEYRNFEYEKLQKELENCERENRRLEYLLGEKI